MPPENRIDLRGGLSGQVTVTPEEHPDERDVRLRALARQTLIDDAKGIATFVVLLVAIIFIGMMAAYVAVLDTTASPITRQWAQTILTALMSGGISFIVGRRLGATK